ncbi:hypothetical protein J2X20_002469 [Pelomonas saccharophila]|uniref:Lipoprotein n=1 Tax=Roseateles saccharophilus TaxID=304 RepID=A0ABU1YNP1_ROSSA|nr:hypothetical protein [Roseateles saccharophilus]MDR7269840.1 hypothetical protein [Roseateles saccharophilus]
MTFPNCRVPASLGCAVLALAGCGAPSDDTEPLDDAFNCTVRNCTESSTLRVDEISPRFTATQIDANRAIFLEGFLGKSANATTTVLLAGNESLMASTDAEPEVRMNNPDGKRLDYSLYINASAAQPLVRVVFTRAGVRHVSEVMLPAAFTILQPTGAPTLRRSGSALAVRLNLATSGDASAAATGGCTRADNSSFPFKDLALAAVTEAGVAGGYRLEPATVDTAMNNASRAANKDAADTPAVRECQFTVAWIRTAYGTIAPTMNGHGTLRGQREATHPLNYDARS